MWGDQPYRNRADAGRVLAAHLERYKDRPDTLVLGLARGGIPVAFEVARGIYAPLEVFAVRKLGVPGHEELAMGAIASGGLRVLNMAVIRELEIPDEVVEQVTAREQEELERRGALYRGGRPPLSLENRTVILVDDGLATGTSMRVAIAAVRRHNSARIVVAVPVASAETCEELRSEADEVVCPLTPANFYAVGAWYEDFNQTTDEEVRALVERGGPDA
jgi:putative phosphoribosyl transferase